ncbi:MAG TPA: hypothetical protein PK385_08495 [Spirochaetota bacterium]|nr:hypothetical protein [Spirochaetota bacterium]HOS31652.1 hypothetical protein [Spirochaetota bacterium]HOS56083.1 hypothetical protein [Spirochaetota bacterium]HPK63034.1 hypothetical protein [Spirochaetota bacterium]HQF77238.1 hypothetical protein [Spirochaetota bacterium]
MGENIGSFVGFISQEVAKLLKTIYVARVEIEVAVADDFYLILAPFKFFKFTLKIKNNRAKFIVAFISKIVIKFIYRFLEIYKLGKNKSARIF